MYYFDQCVIPFAEPAFPEGIWISLHPPVRLTGRSIFFSAGMFVFNGGREIALLVPVDVRSWNDIHFLD